MEIADEFFPAREPDAMLLGQLTRSDTGKVAATLDQGIAMAVWNGALGSNLRAAPQPDQV